MYSGLVKSRGHGQTWFCRMKNKEDGEQESPREAAGAGSAQHVSPLLAPLLKWWCSQACQAGLSHISEQGDWPVSVCSCSCTTSWRRARGRVWSCRSSPTPSCSRSRITAPTSWSRSSTPLRSPPDLSHHSTPVAKPSQSTEPREWRAMWKTEHGIETFGAPLTTKTKAKKNPF